jgi:hypothetical protein
MMKEILSMTTNNAYWLDEPTKTKLASDLQPGDRITIYTGNATKPWENYRHRNLDDTIIKVCNTRPCVSIQTSNGLTFLFFHLREIPLAPEFTRENLTVHRPTGETYKGVSIE